MKISLLTSNTKLIIKSFLITGLTCQTTFAQNAHCHDGADFSYTSQNEIMVLDDGKDTRLQFPEGMALPTTVGVRGATKNLVTLRRDGQYFVAPGLYSQLILRWATGSQVVAKYTGACQLVARTAVDVPPPAGAPLAVRAVERVSDVAKAYEPPETVSKNVPVIGSNTGGGSNAEHAKPASVASIVTPLAVAARAVSPAVASPPPQIWEIQLTDGTLSKALIRWSRGTQLPVSWEAGKDFPSAKAFYHGSFLEAVEQVMTDTARSQYPLHACAYDNVLRVLHVSQSCLR